MNFIFCYCKLRLTTFIKANDDDDDPANSVKGDDCRLTGAIDFHYK